MLDGSQFIYTYYHRHHLPATGTEMMQAPAPIAAIASGLGLRSLVFSPQQHHHHYWVSAASPLRRSNRSSTASALSPIQVQADGGDLPLPVPSVVQPPQDLKSTVHVKFLLKKECSFGDQFLLVGDILELGQWEITKAIPLEWSEGNVWSIGVDLPADETIHFKFILRSPPSGEITWQPDPDRVLQTWETTNIIYVLDHWDDAEKQKIGEHQSDVSIEDVKHAWNLGGEPDSDVHGDDEDTGENLPISQAGEKKSIDEGLLEIGHTGNELVPGLKSGPDSIAKDDAEVDVGDGADGDAFKPKERKELKGKAGSTTGEKALSSEAVVIAEANSDAAVAAHPDEGIINPKQESSKNNLNWGHETLSRVHFLAMALFIRVLA